VLETCGSPTFLDQKNVIGVGPRLFVTCFADGEIYVFDPTVPRLVTTFRVGRGPAGLVFDEHRPVAYAVGFGDNNVSVIDLQPGSATEYHYQMNLHCLPLPHDSPIAPYILPLKTSPSILILTYTPLPNLLLNHSSSNTVTISIKRKEKAKENKRMTVRRWNGRPSYGVRSSSPELGAAVSSTKG
jgi:hypothetical protein